MQHPLTCSDLADIYRDRIAMVRRRAKQLVLSDHIADDVAQDVFVKLLKYLVKEPVVTNISGLLYRMATQSAIEKLQEQKRVALMEDESTLADRAPVGKEEHMDLIRLLGKVNTEEALVACYYFLDGQSQEYIAEEMGISRRTVGRHLDAFTANARRTVGPNVISIQAAG